MPSARHLLSAALCSLLACSGKQAPTAGNDPAPTPAKDPDPQAAHMMKNKQAPAQGQDQPPIGKGALAALTAELVKAHGEASRERVTRGLAQVASLWRNQDDGDLAAFAREHFVSDPKRLDTTFARLQDTLEQIDGHLLEISRELRRPSDVDIGPLLPVDHLLGGLDPSAHIVEDLFRSRVAFVALLNFPLTTLKERAEGAKGYSRRRFAEVRLTGRFARRVPADVQQRIARESADASLYISGYNLWLHHLLDEGGGRPFQKGLRLISHWNLRDEIRASYADARALPRQRAIAKAMERIVTQTIPQVVIDNPRVDWNPTSNAVTASPPEEIEDNAPVRAVQLGPGAPEREPDTRYARLLSKFHAQRAADPYSPSVPTLIARSFELGREMPEERVVALLTEVCASPLASKVGALIEARLGRKLEPHDIWYSGFQPRGQVKIPEKDLDAITQRRYPTPAAFQADLPNILQKLGFSRERARFLAEHIAVDPSRGAGHALEAARRGDLPRLRTRIGPQGMDYKGYNIAIHELGHNVEQVFSLYEVDHTLLRGVPNNAFTEALAFVFQARDLELLGLAKPDPAAERLRAINDFWMTWEISGVGLVDIKTWHWMYDHPDATPAQLREEVVRISKGLWNRYYAPVLGGPDTVLLGIYSHMIQETLYLPDYPLGHLIAFQIEEHLRKKGKAALGAEFERMARHGAVLPDLWMEHATGAPISAAPLLKATEAALQAMPAPSPSSTPAPSPAPGK